MEFAVLPINPIDKKKKKTKIVGNTAVFLETKESVEAVFIVIDILLAK